MDDAAAPVAPMPPSSNSASMAKDHTPPPKEIFNSIMEFNHHKSGVKPEMIKTSLCPFFRKRKTCSRGKECRFAHGETELRQRPDGSWDPLSERGKELAKAASQGRTDDGGADGVGTMKDEDGEGLFFKCIVDVPATWDNESFKGFLGRQGVSFSFAKKRKKFGVGFVGFESEEHVELAKQKLDGKQIHSKKLKVADVLPRAWEKRVLGPSKQAGKIIKTVQTDEDSKGHSSDDGKCIPSDLNRPDTDVEATDDVEATEKFKDVSDSKDVTYAVTPLAKLSYEEQLRLKMDEVAKILKKLAPNVRKAAPADAFLPEWITSARSRGGLPCDFLGIIPSPVVDGYRNKCEFTIGCSSNGNRVVGFQRGSFREGIFSTEEASSCRNISALSRFFAGAFQEFVQNSELPVWDKKENKGFWRLFTVREGRVGSKSDESGSAGSSIAEVMLIVQVCSIGTDEDMRMIEFRRMSESLAIAASTACPPLPLTALIVQDHQEISNAASPDAPLQLISIPEVSQGKIVEGKGKASQSHIYDHICNLRFRVSASAFFQVNTIAAEKLYVLAGDWAGLSQDTILFDVCCGTGTIGLTLAHRVGLVIGIEKNASAVADARINAEINGISNCEFICAKAEDVMDSLMKKYLEKHMQARANDEGSNSFRGKSDNLTTQAGKPSSKADMSEAVENTQNSGVQKAGEIQDVDKIDGENLDEMSDQRRFTDVVVIVDPPRSGLHPVVLRSLRTREQLCRLVYVSCNPETLLANAVELCTPTASRKGKMKGNKVSDWRGMSVVGHARQRMKSMPRSQPFKPVKAMAVDLFPHTQHCEMVMLMER